MFWVRSLIPAVIVNFKYLLVHMCYNLNKEDANVFVDLVDAYETLHRELTKSMKISKKFKS